MEKYRVPEYYCIMLDKALQVLRANPDTVAVENITRLVMEGVAEEKHSKAEQLIQKLRKDAMILLEKEGRFRLTEKGLTFSYMEDRKQFYERQNENLAIEFQKEKIIIKNNNLSIAALIISVVALVISLLK